MTTPPPAEPTTPPPANPTQDNPKPAPTPESNPRRSSGANRPEHAPSHRAGARSRFGPFPAGETGTRVHRLQTWAGERSCSCRPYTGRRSAVAAVAEPLRDRPPGHRVRAAGVRRHRARARAAPRRRPSFAVPHFEPDTLPEVVELAQRRMFQRVLDELTARPVLWLPDAVGARLHPSRAPARDRLRPGSRHVVGARISCFRQHADVVFVDPLRDLAWSEAWPIIERAIGARAMRASGQHAILADTRLATP